MQLVSSVLTNDILSEAGYNDGCMNTAGHAPDCALDSDLTCDANDADTSKCPLFSKDAFTDFQGFTSDFTGHAVTPETQFWNNFLYVEDEAAYNNTCAQLHTNFYGSGYNLTCVENELKKDIKATLFGIGLLRYTREQYREVSKMPDALRKRNLIDLSVSTDALGDLPATGLANLAGPRPCIQVDDGSLYYTCMGKSTGKTSVGTTPVVEQISELSNP
jgi:hypothetical protein